ncbi:MAG: hypothetical protein CSB23_03795 [Deltaproteobacteria bacterium]|nr:MAG: hypothetical protein CSB23_03795 [Deltaproteobacteria bacterium]
MVVGTQKDCILKRDSLFEGELVCEQYADGYRFSVDAVLLAHFVQCRKPQRLIELGTGSGILLLLLLYRQRERLLDCLGVEVQSRLYNLAKRNMALNGFYDLVSLLHCDVEDIADHIAAESFDSVVFNPPFYPENSGRSNHNPEVNRAKHQTLSTLQHFLRAASYVVRNKGDVYCIYAAENLGRLIAVAQQCHLEPKLLRPVYAYPDQKKGAQLVLLQCKKNAGPGLKILPPLYIYEEKNGGYSKELMSCYAVNTPSQS